MSKPSIKEIIAQELIRCAKEPQYFMKKYCVVQHPMRGKVPFHLYDYQEKSLLTFEDYRFNIVLKARQLGISTLSAGYALWMMLFHNDKNILVSDESHDVAWVHKSDVLKKNSEESIARMLKKMEQRYS